MGQADMQYNELVNDIYKNGQWDKDGDVRTVYADGDSAFTKSLFGVQMKYDSGEIPILTNKKVSWKTSLREILLFWQKQTTNIEDFHKENVHIWDEWFNANGDLGTSYAYQFESRPKKEIIKVKRRLRNDSKELSRIKVNDLIEVSKIEGSIVGEIFETNESGDIKILEKVNDRPICYSVQFLNTGYIMSAYKANIVKGEVNDPYARSVNDIGYYGRYNDVKGFSDYEVTRLKYKWRAMIDRCYNPSSDRFNSYGDIGVFVCEEWHSFENFIKDVRYLPQWFLAKRDLTNWEMDKDFYGSNCYSSDTCVFLHRDENIMYRKQSKAFILHKPTGEKEIYLNQLHALVNRELSRTSLSGMINGKQDNSKGYSVELLDESEYVYRFKISSNQVVDLIKNMKSNPLSRRLMTSFWNDADVQEKALQECAWATEWNIRDGKLDLLLIQRSGDIGLGIPFNQIQYYLLQCMFAHVANLDVGAFTHQIGNIHYYDRHEEILLKQVESATYESPKLWINPDVKDFFDFTSDDFKLINYKHGDSIKMEVAI